MPTPESTEAFLDRTTLIAIGTLLVAIVPSVIMMYWTRAVNTKDALRQAWHDSMEKRMSDAEAKGHAQDLAIQEKVSREEMETVYGKIDAVKTSLESKLDKLQDLMVKIATNGR